MTVLTKASDMGRKPNLMGAPLVVENQRDPEQANPRRPPRAQNLIYHSPYRRYMICFRLISGMVLLASLLMGLVYVFSTDFNDTPRYKGYCAIPIEMPRDIRLQKQAALAESLMPLRWSSEPEVSIFSTVDEQTTGDALNSLLERFDIDDNVEKISVYNSGRNVEFIHDFNANATGIVDKERCFTMELDPRAVLSPAALVLSIERGAAFDVMRVRTHARARLPPAPALLAGLAAGLLADRCAGKPTYELERGNDIIRKRSVDEPTHEYLHFAGNHVQEIAIDNLQELLDYEQKLPA